jgi:hypothetical protein
MHLLLLDVSAIVSTKADKGWYLTAVPRFRMVCLFGVVPSDLPNSARSHLTSFESTPVVLLKGLQEWFRCHRREPVSREATPVGLGRRGRAPHQEYRYQREQ